MGEFYERALRVQTYDIDFAGVVSNIVFIRWARGSSGSG